VPGLTALAIVMLCFCASQGNAQDSVSRATLELFKGAEKNDIEMVKRAIHAGADIMARNPLGQRAHDVAVDLNNIAVAHYILSMRPKAKVPPVRRAVTGTPGPASPVPVNPVAVAKPLPAPLMPLKSKMPKRTGPIVSPISKSQSLEISKKAAAVQPRAVVPKAVQKVKAAPARSKPLVKKVAPVQRPAKPVVKTVAKPVTVPSPKPAAKKTAKPAKKVVRNVPAVLPVDNKPVAMSDTSKMSGEFNFFGNHISYKASANLRCLNKPDGIRVCLQPLKWPKHLTKWFDIDTVFYDGVQSLVMFQEMQLRQIHVLFKQDGFEAISRHLSDQLEKAGQTGALKRSEFKEFYLGKFHRYLIWQGLKGSWPDSLEIRELDSLRWSALPDEQHGVVRIFRHGADPIFKHVSAADFMLGFLATDKKVKK
jgi:hypothetical protein